MTKSATDTKTPLVGSIDELPSSTAITHSADGRRPLAVAADVAAPSMQQLLHFAIERGTPVEQLEKLVDLADRMDKRQAARDFAAAMAAFQAECPSIKKGKSAKITTKSGNAGYSYTYADLDMIVTVVRPILTKHGLSYRFNTKLEGRNLSVDCFISHVNGHEAPPSNFTLPIDNPSAMSDQQKVGAASMYGRRQALTSALGITGTDQDVDGAAVEAADPTKIDEDSVLALEDLIKEIGTDKARFLAYMGAESLSDLRAAEYPRAVATLEQIRSKKQKGAAQ